VTVPNGVYHSNTYDYSNTAFYLQDDISPFKALHITPSVRFVDYNINYANGGQNAFPAAYALNPTANQGFGTSQYAQQNRTGVEPSVDVNLDVTKWLSFYGSYDESYKSPSLNGGGGLFVTIPQQYYQLELAQEGQVGVKMNVTDAGWLNKLLVQAGYFHLRYADQNVNVTTANLQTISGVGTSTYQGMNVSLDDNPMYNWHVFANAAVEAAYYTNYQVGSVTSPTKFTGLPVPYVPQQTLNLGTYVKQDVNKVVVTPSIWYQFTGEQFIFNNLTGAPSKQGALPAYGTLNLSLDVKVPVDLLGPKVLDFNAQVLNISGQKYNSYAFITSGGYFNGGAGSPLFYPGAPLTLFGSVGLSF
jgi:iron complex outermembrane receptor protein